MQVLNIQCNGHEVKLNLTPWNGTEELFVDGKLVSKKHNNTLSGRHDVAVSDLGDLRLNFRLNISKKEVIYECYLNGQLIEEGSQFINGVITSPGLKIADELRHKVEVETSAQVVEKKPGMTWVLLPIIFKLFKSVQVIKVALLAASVGAYSLIFSPEFALVLVGVLVFHEYGHLRAMKKFGIPTKGMYLIPFVGGIAVGDAAKTRWQDVYISMMGPVYGLIMTIAFYLIYLITESHFAGLIASTSALLNLFNLIPVHPLDGGRVIKSLVFSGRNRIALVGLLFVSSICLVLAWQAGFVFLIFFIVLGCLDIIGSWRVSLAEDMTPLTPYGIVFSLAWYLITAMIFIGLIVLIAADHLPGSEIAIRVLQS